MTARGVRLHHRPVPRSVPTDVERVARRLVATRIAHYVATSAARMHEVMAIYAHQAGIRLAKDHQQAKLMTCFAGTSHFNPNAAPFPSAAVKLPAPPPTP